MSLMLTHTLFLPRQARPRDSQWRKRKHGFSRRVLRLVCNGIRLAWVHSNSMVSTTCCTFLLVQGTTDSPT